jgi:colicin import membrane protein
VAAAGAATQHRAVQKARRAAAEQQKRNEELAARAARDAKLRGQHEESRSRTQSAYRLAALRARLSAAGLDLAEGGAFDLLTGEAAIAEEEALTIRANARREALAIRQAAAAGRTEYRAYDAELSGRQDALVLDLAGRGLATYERTRAPSGLGLDQSAPGSDLGRSAPRSDIPQRLPRGIM